MQADQNPQPLAWKKLSQRNDTDFPFITTYSRASLFENYVLFFGRYVSHTNNILTFNLETLNWVSIPLHIPSEDHLLASAISYTVIPYGDNKFILYGGSQTGRTYLEMITIDKSSGDSPLQLEWQDLSRSITETLPFRRYFTANICDDKMYIYGGLDSKNKIDPSLHIIYLGSGSYVNRIQFGVNAMKPGGRYNHGSVLYKGSLYVYGGYSEDARCLNDLWALNLETMEWQELASRSQISTPKINSLCQVIEDTIVIAGGMNGQGWHQDCITYKINGEFDSFKRLDLKIEQPISQNQTFFGIYENRLLLVKDFEFYSLDQKAIVPEEQPKEHSENITTPVSFQSNDQKFFQEKPFADLVFRVQGEEIKAHKAFLAARCSYFNNMFQSGMIEGNSNVIDVPEIKPKTFEAFLEFIYCGEVTSEDENIWLDLLEMSDKYCLKSLEELCSSSLKGKMSKENVVKAANLAERLGMEDLKQEALSFMIRDFDAVFEGQDIRELSRELLMALFKMK